MCSWPIFVYAGHLWDTVGCMVHQHCPRSCCSRFGTLQWILSSVQWGPCRGDFNMACGQRIHLLLTFFLLRLNNMPPLRCWSQSFNFPEFATVSTPSPPITPACLPHRRQLYCPSRALHWVTTPVPPFPPCRCRRVWLNIHSLERPCLATPVHARNAATTDKVNLT